MNIPVANGAASIPHVIPPNGEKQVLLHVCCAVCAAADCASANSSAVVSSRFLGMASSCFIDHPSPGSARAFFVFVFFFAERPMESGDR